MSVLRGYARLREYNDCNLPAGSRDGGRFGSNNDPRCGAGRRPFAAADASPEQPLYDASADGSALTFSAENYVPFLRETEDYSDEPGLKKLTVSEALALRLRHHASDAQIDALYRELEPKIGSFVNFLDPDDVAVSDALSELLKFPRLESAPDPDSAEARQAYDARHEFDRGAKFDRWYEDTYELTTAQYRAWRGQDSPSVEAKAAGLAAILLRQWAVTSGDDQRDSIALQLATAEEFDLDSAYTRHLTGDGVPTLNSRNAERLLEDHGPVLRGFVRAMYEHTQEQLGTLFPGSDHVTLFRGFTPAAGANALDPQGALVDVNLQPASSFSVSPRTAAEFGPSFFAVTVPKSRILSTSLSGFGCLHEWEAVVLGGRATGVVTDADAVKALAPSADTPVQGSTYAQRYARAVVQHATQIAQSQRRANGKGKA